MNGDMGIFEGYGEQDEPASPPSAVTSAASKLRLEDAEAWARWVELGPALSPEKAAARALIALARAAKEVYRVAAEVPWMQGTVNPVREAEAKLKAELERWE